MNREQTATQPGYMVILTREQAGILERALVYMKLYRDRWDEDLVDGEGLFYEYYKDKHLNGSDNFIVPPPEIAPGIMEGVDRGVAYINDNSEAKRVLIKTLGDLWEAFEDKPLMGSLNCTLTALNLMDEALVEYMEGIGFSFFGEAETDEDQFTAPDDQVRGAIEQLRLLSDHVRQRGGVDPIISPVDELEVNISNGDYWETEYSQVEDLIDYLRQYYN